MTFEAKAGRWVGVKCGMYIRNISGKEGGALSLKGKAEEKAGMAGLREELEKTKLDV